MRMLQEYRRIYANVPVEQLVSPPSARPLWPNASGSSVRSVDRNRFIIGTSVEGEVWVRVKNEPIRTGEIASPVLNSGEPVSDGDVEAFADAGDLSEYIVSLDVAAQWVSKSC